jgi:hypothetical protein
MLSQKCPQSLTNFFGHILGNSVFADLHCGLKLLKKLIARGTILKMLFNKAALGFTDFPIEIIGKFVAEFLTITHFAVTPRRV